MRRLVSAAILLGGILALGALVTLSGCPSRGGDSPEATFERALQLIREGKYDRIWGLFTETYQRQIVASFEEHKRILREAGENRLQLEDLIRMQTGLEPEVFLAKPPREIYEIVARRQREQSLKQEIVRRGPITGDRATLYIRGAPEWPESPWHFRRVDGRWLIDDVPTNPRGSPFIRGGPRGR